MGDFHGASLGVAEAAASAIVVEGGSDLPESPGAEREWIAVHLALRPGYSGGPLVDHQGKLIGAWKLGRLFRTT